jgi:methyl-accepting chemotaxis protein
VQTLLPNFENINVAMGHQSENASSITGAMISLSERMRATMDSLQTSYSFIEQLDRAAKSLQEEVTQFKVN